ncbi:MAG: cytochrome c biogenesis CcdA family protein [Promethearchaeota archaeon]
MNILLLLTAFIGGLASFFNPCSIVMIPSFIALITAEGISQKRGIMLSIFYGLGFTFLFALIGVLLVSIQGFILNQPWIQLIGGILIIFLGFAVAFDIFIRHSPYTLNDQNRSEAKSPNADKNDSVKGNKSGNESSDESADELKKKKVSYGTSFILGISNATAGLGCIGPLFGSVMAAIYAENNVIFSWSAFFLYGLGIILPFLVLGLVIGKLNELFLLKMIKFSIKLKYIMGIILVILGIYFIIPPIQTLIARA